MRSTIFQLMIHTLDPLAGAKFKDKVDILSNIAKAKVDSLAGQGSKSEGECKKGQCCLPYYAVIPHIPSSQYPMAGKETLQYDRFYY